MTQSLSCPQCGLNLNLASLQATGNECPNCAYFFPASIVQSAQRDTDSWIKDYYQTLWGLLTRPTSKIEDLKNRNGYVGPLTFILITHWIGEAGKYLWQSAVTTLAEPHFQGLFQFGRDVLELDSQNDPTFLEWKTRLSEWAWGTGAVLLDPFKTLILVVFSATLTWIGARILVTPGKDGAPQSITGVSAVQVVSYGMAPSLLNFIPMIGPFLASLGTLVLTVILAKGIYRVPTGKGILIALFPKILISVFLLGGLFWILMGLWQFFSAGFFQ